MHYPVVVIGSDDETRKVLTMKACLALRGDWGDEGGRYQGLLDGYDPQGNPENWEACDLCGGTGTRPDGLERFGPEWVEQMGGCNGCQGKGERLKWATQWAPHEEWLAAEAMLNPAHVPWGVVLPDGRLVEIDEDDDAEALGIYRETVGPWAIEGYRATVADVHT